MKYHIALQRQFVVTINFACLHVNHLFAQTITKVSVTIHHSLQIWKIEGTGATWLRCAVQAL